MKNYVITVKDGRKVIFKFNCSSTDAMTAEFEMYHYLSDETVEKIVNGVLKIVVKCN